MNTFDTATRQASRHQSLAIAPTTNKLSKAVTNVLDVQHRNAEYGISQPLGDALHRNGALQQDGQRLSQKADSFAIIIIANPSCARLGW